MSFIGIDFGASFVKGAVLDIAAGSIRNITRLPFPPFLTGLPPGYREVDPMAITHAFRHLLESLLQAEPHPEGLVTCSQMHGLIFVDAQGQPASNYHSWQDQRVQEIDARTGRSYFDGMVARLSDSEQAAVGREVRAGLPSSQLFWLAQKQRLPAGAWGCALPEYILAQACRQPPVTEATLASGYGLFDVNNGVWRGEVLDKLELPAGLLPAIVPTGSLIGEFQWQGHQIPCYTPVGDQQCALLGVGLQEEELSLNISTGSQASLRSPVFTSGPHQTRPYFDGGFLRTITHIPAGRSLQALIRLLTELHPTADLDLVWDSIVAKLEQVPETDLQADLSFFPGAFGSHGTLGRLREENLNVGNVFLAALASMAGNFRRAAERLSPEKSWRGLVLSGGLAQKITRLQQLIQREIPGPQRLPVFPEDTLRGLLILASYWGGARGSLAEIQARIMARTEP